MDVLMNTSRVCMVKLQGPLSGCVCSDRALRWSEGTRPLLESDCSVCACSVTDGITKTETGAETGGRDGWKTVSVWRGECGTRPQALPVGLHSVSASPNKPRWQPCSISVTGLPGGRRGSWCLPWLLSSPVLRPRHPHVSKELAESIS